MPHIEATPETRQGFEETGSVAGTRIDAAHVMHGPPREPAAQEAPAEPFVLGSPEEVQAQAKQLAAMLQARHEDLARREERLNAQLADFDRQMRAARLWIEERQQEQADREVELSKRAAEIEAAEAQRLAAVMDGARKKDKGDGRLAALAAAQQELRIAREQTENALRRMRQEIDTRREASLQLVRLSLEGLERRRKALEEKAAELEAQTRQSQSEHLRLLRAAQSRTEALDSRERALDIRERQIAEREALLAKEYEDVERMRIELVEQRTRDEAQLRLQKHRLAEREKDLEEKLSAERESVARQAEQLDTRRAALDQMRTELAELHHQTLEMRLATEEIWTQLSGTVAPSALTRALATIRAQLQDRYKLEREALDARKAEIEALAADLAEQAENLRAQKNDLLAWINRREADLNRQAEELFNREQRLIARDRELDDERRAWRSERIEFQEKTRQLMVALRTADSPAAA